jgi:predicted HicB family RNase H-like nuclease
MNTIDYKFYTGAIEVDQESGCLHGKVLFINDLVTFQGASFSELMNDFQGAVDDYLALCKKIGKQPDKPFSGTFNVRVGPELHAAAARAALATDSTLNDFVRRAIGRETGLAKHRQSRRRSGRLHAHA